MAPAISIVIPTKNAGEEFRHTLQAIREQEGPPPELVVVDSASTDGTPELAGRYGARTISIAASSFNHGGTRNLGIRESSGDLCILLVQDAVPSHREWLTNLVSPFSDARVVGVSGRQEPRPDADPFGRWEVEWANRFMGERPLVREVEKWDDFLALSLHERLQLAWFNNVCSAVRRDFWERQPFRSVAFAEDLDWSVRALAAGRRIAYNPSARVIHSHNRPAAYNLNRTYVGYKIVPTLVQTPFGDPGVYTDAEFFFQIGSLCGEVESLLRAQMAGSPRRWAFRELWTSVRDLGCSFLAATGFRRPRLGGRQTVLGQGFYDLLEELRTVEPVCDPPVHVHILVQALARAIGVFAACYYNWCEANGVVSAELRRLDAILSEGV
jgi:rhamnosyltransferase